MEPRAREQWSTARPGRDHPLDAVCIAPWVSLEFDPQGWVYTCCANQQYPLGRIGDDRLRDLWGGERAMVLREALGRWDLSVGCGSCRWHLEHGRMDPDAAVYDRYRLDEPEPEGPASMTFALSNRCNLGCVMCNGELSSTLRHQAGLAPLPARYGDDFFEDLVRFLPSLQYAKFLGGEPFLIPEHDRVWRLMDEVGGPPRMQVTTNGTVWTDRVEWLVNRFDVDVTLSIDAVTPELYESIRVGASHAALMKNVERFRARCAEAGTELRLCFCLMASNWRELPDYLAWADELGAPVSINVVSDVGHALHDLPLTELSDVLDHWSVRAPRLERNASVWDTQMTQLRSVVDERRRGVPPAPRQAQPAPATLLEAPAHLPVSDRDASELERSRLRDWSGGSAPAEIHADRGGTIDAVDGSLAHLGLDGSLIGTPLRDLMTAMVDSGGRPAWTIDALEVAGALVRTVVLASQRPQRGSPGTVVRTVTVADPSGWTLFVAEDRSYETGTTVEFTSSTDG